MFNLSAHDVDRWGTLDVLAHIFQQPLHKQWYVLRTALQYTAQAVQVAWRQTLEAKEQIKTEIATQQGLDHDQIDALRAVQAKAIYDSIFDITQFLFLDRLLLMMLTVLLALLCLRSGSAPSTIAAALTLLSVATVGAYLLLARRFAKRYKDPSIQTAAFTIAQQLRVPLIVLGHFHRFERHEQSNTVYVNLGTWSHTLDTSTQPQSTCAFQQTQPFVILRPHAHSVDVLYANWTQNTTQIQKTEERTRAPQTSPVPFALPIEQEL
ncbi:MAG: hypothetical protein AAGJ35_10670 [Myxococcota bacterium]